MQTSSNRITKYRKKALYFDLRSYLGEVFGELAQARECEVVNHRQVLICL
ncbi:MAG: hypothetical protein LJE96_17525 [Deltaproteobacteria bacterium]|nr:hypothetical protein [Deltaproteobacteria bacterium]